MTNVYDIPADILIRQVAEELKQKSEIAPPEWAAFAKTGISREMPPEDPDWWYVRAASLLRKIYVNGPMGVQRMRSAYGGARDRGSAPSRFKRGSGAIVRTMFQQFEDAGLIEKNEKGRVISARGRSFLDGAANSSKEKALEAFPGLEKY